MPRFGVQSKRKLGSTLTQRGPHSYPLAPLLLLLLEERAIRKRFFAGLPSRRLSAKDAKVRNDNIRPRYRNRFRRACGIR